ncbi:uncharacterized protein VTP21DRAFT_75 [Calcarisporiella thermophila]|uniref:uncharacterized protein n=1 Tax=Calcarisporiella thermophila TaxID=911321 RepID=UPI00374332A1
MFRRLSHMVPWTRPTPLLAVVGTTGVGKSQLAVELAKSLGGQVINADSMQVYKGLDIITNKIPLAEREGIEHRLMDFLEVHDEYTVGEFERDALQVINENHEKGRVPIIAGGTNYYVQSLIFRDSLVASASHAALSDSDTESEHPELQGTTAELYARLQEVDPVMANRWHPNDRRKIRRSLEVFLQTGKRHSDIILEQWEGDFRTSRVRFPTCVFWLYTPPETLNPRLDARVESMIKTGLFEELRNMRSLEKSGQARCPGNEQDYTRGIWQAIGYKEFLPYFSALESPPPSFTEEALATLRDQCISAMKAATRRYAKRQITWIRNKLVPMAHLMSSNTPPDTETDHTTNEDDTDASRDKHLYVYMLDATNLDRWNEEVRDVAVQIARDFLAGQPLPDPRSLSPLAAQMVQRKQHHEADTAARLKSWRKFTCDICTDGEGQPLVVNGEKEWNAHRQSRGHWRRVRATKRNEEWQRWKEKMRDSKDKAEN